MFLRAATSSEAKTSQGCRSPHELEEMAARDTIHLHLRGTGGKFPLEPIAELGSVLELILAAPVLLGVGRLRRVIKNLFHR